MRHFKKLAAMFAVSTAPFLGTALADPAAGAALPADGVYASPDDNYRITVKFEPKKILVVEPNKMSAYIRRGDSRTYDYIEKNGVAYVLDVVPDGLKAYKRKTPENVTLMKPVATAPATSGSASGSAFAAAMICKTVLPIPVKNEAALNPKQEDLYGTRKIPEVTVTGTYVEKGGGPVIRLDPSGKGSFEMHGAPKPEHVYGITWWLQANCDGTLIKVDHPKAEVYSLIVEYDRPYQQMRFQRLGLVVQKGDDGELFILDRAKKK